MSPFALGLKSSTPALSLASPNYPTPTPHLTSNTLCSLSPPPLNALLPLLGAPIASSSSGQPPPTGSPPCFVQPVVTLPSWACPWLVALCHFVPLLSSRLRQTVSFLTTTSLFLISGSLSPSTRPGMNLTPEGINRSLSISAALAPVSSTHKRCSTDIYQLSE